MKSTSTERGATLVESAVSLLLLLTVVFGIIEFGRLYNVYQVMTGAAREGARFAVAPCPFNSSIGTTCTAGNLPSTTDVQNVVQTYLNSDNITGATVTVNNACNSASCPGWPGAINGINLSYTSVTVSLPYTFYFFGYRPTIRTNAVMRNETN